MTKPTYRIVENFLPFLEFQRIQKYMFQELPWFYVPSVVFEDSDELDDLEKFLFSHYFIDYGHTRSSATEVLEPLLRNLDAASFYRIRANLQTRTPKPVINYLHTDVTEFENPELITAVYYLNTCNGGTIFENGEVVESVENRLVLFPALTPHTGMSSSNVKARVVININFIQKSGNRWIGESSSQSPWTEHLLKTQYPEGYDRNGKL